MSPLFGPEFFERKKRLMEKTPDPPVSDAAADHSGEEESGAWEYRPEFPLAPDCPSPAAVARWRQAMGIED